MQKLIRFLFFSLFVLSSGCVSTDSIPDVQTMLINLSSSFPDLWRLATAFAYVAGFSIAFKAVYELRMYGEGRTMMSSQHSMKKPLIYLMVAAALIFSPTMYQSLLLSTFGTTTTSPIDYTAVPSGISPAAVDALYGLIQVVGVFAFIRGWIIISRTAEQSQRDTFGKGLTHIIGGLLAINIVGTKDMIFASFGLS